MIKKNSYCENTESDPNLICISMSCEVLSRQRGKFRSILNHGRNNDSIGHVELEGVCQSLWIGAQLVQDTLWKLGKGSISRRKDCQRCCLATKERPYQYIEWSFTLSIHVCVYILIVFTVLCKKVQENIFFKRTRFDTSTLVVLIIKIKIEMNT